MYYNAVTKLKLASLSKGLSKGLIKKGVTMKKVISRYVLEVLEDGSLNLIEFDQAFASVPPKSECSSSINQIVKICDYILDHPDDHIHLSTTQGVNHVAKMYGITSSSVHAKITRKLGLSMAEFKKILDEYLEGKTETFAHVLRNACVARTKLADFKEVEALLLRLRPSSGSAPSNPGVSSPQ